MQFLSRIKYHNFRKGLHHSRLLSWMITEDNILTTKESFEYPQENLFTFFTKELKQYGDKPAIVDAITDKKFTFNELITKSKQLASFFDQKGYKENDVAAIHITNCIEYPVSFFGTVANGMILTTANPAYTETELCNQFNSSNPKILFTNSKLLNHAQNVADKTNIEMIISVDEPSVKDNGIIYFYDAINMGDKNFNKAFNFDPKKQIAALPYSSGTTGLPKGVMISHYNMTTNVRQFISNLNANKERYFDIMTVLPMYHIYALQVMTATYLCHGCTIHTLPQFEPESFLNAIQKYKLEVLPLVPPLLLFLLNHPMVDNYDISSVKAVLCGAAPLEENIVNAFNKKFPNIKVMQGYGSTECLINSKQLSNIGPEPTQGSVGKLFIDTELKVMCQDTGKNLGPNERGEICIRGPQTSLGYFNNPGATAQCFSDDGWVQTGDIGYYNEQHEIFVVDRIKELIKFKGFQVAPSELEGLLLSHKDILDSCVIGVPDDIAGEVPRGYIVKTPNSTLSEEDVHKFIAEHVSDHKKLRGGIEFIEAIPKSPSGKILRRLLKEEFLKQQKN